MLLEGSKLVCSHGLTQSSTWGFALFCPKILGRPNAHQYGEFFRKHRMACTFTEKGRRKHLTILSERVHYWTDITNKRISIHFYHLNWKHTVGVDWLAGKRKSNWKVYGTDGWMVSMARPFGNVCTPLYRAFLHWQTHGKTTIKNQWIQ